SSNDTVHHAADSSISPQVSATAAATIAMLAETGSSLPAAAKRPQQTANPTALVRSSFVAPATVSEPLAARTWRSSTRRVLTTRTTPARACGASVRFATHRGDSDLEENQR